MTFTYREKKHIFDPYLLQAKIMQCQQTTLDLGAKLAAEKRDRDQDFDQVSNLVAIQVFLANCKIQKWHHPPIVGRDNLQLTFITEQWLGITMEKI